MSTIQRLADRGIAKPPSWLPTNTVYETIMGSVAYGVSSDTSDMDIYGFCIPKKEQVFPHLAGEIEGFSRQKKRFEQYQEHHMKDPDAMSGHGRVYDVTIYNIVKFFMLAMENNANIIDSLFTPINCVLHCTNVGNIVRENRKTFLHKGVWHKMKGYAYSQLHKIASKEHEGMAAVIKFERDHGIPENTPLCDLEKEIQTRQVRLSRSKPSIQDNEVELFGYMNDADLSEYHRLYREMTDKSVRSERTKIHGFDVKFAYHTVRLLLEAEMILVEHDLDLQRNNEQLKSIRRGEWTETQLLQWATDKEKQLEKVYHESTLQHSPDEGKIKAILLHCLEEHYGSLSECIVNPDAALMALREINDVIQKNSKFLSL